MGKKCIVFNCQVINDVCSDPHSYEQICRICKANKGRFRARAMREFSIYADREVKHILRTPLHYLKIQRYMGGK